jgi:hypothetical protein
MRIALLSMLLVLTQAPDRSPGREADDPPRLPDGRSQTEEILKEEHKRSLTELDEIVKLAGDVKADLEKHQHHVVSMTAIKSLDEMEKRMKRIRSRLRRH